MCEANQAIPPSPVLTSTMRGPPPFITATAAAMPHDPISWYSHVPNAISAVGAGIPTPRLSAI